MDYSKGGGQGTASCRPLTGLLQSPHFLCSYVLNTLLLIEVFLVKAIFHFSRMYEVLQYDDIFKEKKWVVGTIFSLLFLCQTLPKDGVKFFQGVLHSHLLGTSIAVRHIRNGKELPALMKGKSVWLPPLKPGFNASYFTLSFPS